MKITLLTTAIVAAFTAAETQQASFKGSAVESVFDFGTPTYFGSGCPKDSVAIIPSSDGQSVSVLFSEFRAQTSAQNNRDRRSCNLAVPVDVKSVCVQ
jgi:hypothetical protein